MLVCVYQQVREKEVPHGKVIMAELVFGYMILWRCGQSWGVEFLSCGYGEASRRAWEMTLYGESDFAKAMHYRKGSYPYDVHNIIRYSDHPLTIDELVDLFERYGLGSYDRIEVRKREVMGMAQSRKPSIDISTVGFW